jgi:hypothetical protein
VFYDKAASGIRTYWVGFSQYSEALHFPSSSNVKICHTEESVTSIPDSDDDEADAPDQCPTYSQLLRLLANADDMDTDMHMFSHIDPVHDKVLYIVEE